MAEAIFESEAEDIDAKADSAGTFAMNGSHATLNAMNALESLGIEAPKHKAKQITGKLTEWADLILVMEETHAEELCAMFPDAEEKTQTLIGFATGESGDISDPFGGDEEEYLQCAEQIKKYVLMALEKFEK